MGIGSVIRAAKAGLRNNPALGVLGGIVVVGFVIRLPGIGYCMTPDEAYSLDEYIRRGWEATILGRYHSGNHPLVSFLAWASISVFGEDDWVIQLPSLVAGMAAIPLAYIAGKRIFENTLIGLTAAFLMAWSPYHVAYSTNMRGYDFAVFFALLTAYWLHENLRRARIVPTLGVGLALFLMAMSHLSSLMVVGAWFAALGLYALSPLVLKERRTLRHWGNLVATAGGLGLGLALTEWGYSPVFSIGRSVLARATTGVWPERMDAYLCAAELTFWHPLSRFTETLTGLSGGAFWWAVALALLGLAAGLAGKKWGAGLFALAIVLPVSGLLVLDMKLEPRYVLTLLPFCVVMLAAGVVYAGVGAAKVAAKLPAGARWAPWGGGAVAVACMVPLIQGVVPLYKEHFPYGTSFLACVFNDWKSAAQYLAENMDGEDMVAYSSQSLWPTAHYLDRYVYPRVTPPPEPLRSRRLWTMISHGTVEENFPVPPGYAPELATTFRGCEIYVGAFETENFREVPLPWFEVNPTLPLNMRVVPWELEGWDLDGLEITEEKEGEHSPALVLQGRGDTACARLLSPVQPCVPGRLTVFRAYVQADTRARNHGIGLRFVDENGQMIDDWFLWTPGQQGDNANGWKLFEVSALASRGATGVRALLIVRAPGRPDMRCAFSGPSLWIDTPGSAAQVQGETP